MKRLKTLPFGAGRDVPRKFQNRLTKRRINLLAAIFLPRRTPCCLLRFSRWHNARVILTLPLSEMYALVNDPSILCSVCYFRERVLTRWAALWAGATVLFSWTRRLALKTCFLCANACARSFSRWFFLQYCLLCFLFTQILKELTGLTVYNCSCHC